MKKKKILSGLLIIILASFIALPTTSDASNYRSLTNDAFTFGERLDYKVGYSMITAGKGYLQVSPMPVEKSGRKCMDIRFRAYSLESLRWIYQVDDAYRTVLDEDGLFPWVFQQKIREGKYKRDVTASFDHINKKAYEKGKTYSIPQYSLDIVAAFYYVRTLNLSKMKNGSKIYVNNYFKGKVNKLAVKIHKRETMEVEAGTFKTIKIEPLVVDGGLFKSEGNIYIWLTDDENKVPVKVSTKIMIGNVYAELTKYSGVKNSLTSKVN